MGELKALLDQKLTVYPHSASDFINIEFEGNNGPFEIGLRSVNGELVKRSKVKSRKEKIHHKMDLKFLSKVFYVLQFRTNEGLLVRKVLIK